MLETLDPIPKQCKDISTRRILKRMARNPESQFVLGFHGGSPGLMFSMPINTPEKLALAKMRSLIRRGLVSGCGCGCRGDFQITQHGIDYLTSGEGR